MTETQRQAWNEALASGDADRIAELQHTLLVGIHRKIMNDDPTYAQAGWKGTE
jgi:hypothetical protein